MNRIRIISFAVCCIAIVSCSKSGRFETADRALDAVLDNYRYVGLAVVVVKDNEVIYSSERGLKNIRTGEKIGKDDLFRIASISKTFTSTAIMQLYEQGCFDLDDDVSEALGYRVRNPAFPDAKITYRMLLSHTSSLSDAQGYFNYDILKPEYNPDYAKVYWDYAPGEKYNYCNLGFNLLGALVEIHSGERFDIYIRRHILLPLGINNAGFNVDSLDNSRFVSLYDRQDSVWIESEDAYQSRAAGMVNYEPGKDAILFSPTGGMKISATDLAKWMICRMNYGSLNGVRIISEASSKQMFTPVQPTKGESSYGLGLMVWNDLIEGETLIGHTGSAYGLLSTMFFDPVKKSGVVMICNGSAPINPEDSEVNHIREDVVKALYGIATR